MTHTTSRKTSRQRHRSSETVPLARRLRIPLITVAVLACIALAVWLAPLPNLFATGGDGGQGVPSYVSPIATAQGDSIPVYRQPGGGSGQEPWKRLSNPNSNGAERTFLVEGSNPGGEWLRVLLPIRPNGSKGWVRTDDVTLSKTSYRVHIYLNEHRVVVKHGANETTVAGQIGVGEGNTPTPGGQYYITSLLKTPKENSLYGPYAFGLSGFSTVLESFGGGPGRIGLHGTNRPELLGQDVSHGCIRMSNPNISKLAGTLPLGTPVYVHD